MKKIADILGQLMLIAKDAKVWFRVLVFVIVGTVCVVIGAVQFSKTKTKTEDCSYYIEQNKMLIAAFIDIKKDLQPAIPTSFIETESEFTFAVMRVVDTLPRKKSDKAKVQMVLSKIDSILLFVIKQQDSINLKNKKQ